MIKKIKFRRIKIRVRYNYSLMLIFSVVLILPLLFLPFYSRLSYFPPGSQSNSYFANYDYKIAKWLSDNTPRNSIILSDYFSMKTYQGLSNRPSLFQGLNAGEESSGAKAALSFIKQDILLASTSKDSYDSILSFSSQLNSANWIQWQERNALVSLGVSLNNSNVFIVINPRTCVWLEQQGINDVREPYYNVSTKYLSVFEDTDYFNLVFSVKDQVYIFAPRNFQSWNAADYPDSVGRNIDDSEVANLVTADSYNKRLIDSSQYSNDGSIFEATPSQGKFGGGLRFDGLNDYVSVPNSPSLNFTNALSVEAWVYPLTVGVQSEVIGRAGQFMLRLDSSDDKSTVSFFVVVNGVYEPRARGVVLPVNEWSFVVGTYDGSQVKIYVNGQLAGSAARSGVMDNSTNPVTIGNVNGNFYNGTISDVHIYNRVLSENETAQHYEHVYVGPVREADASKDSPGYMINIPFKVDRSVNGEIKVDARVNFNNLTKTAFRCEILDETDNTIVFSKEILTTNFVSANIFEKQRISVNDILVSAHQYNLRIYFADNVNVGIDEISLLE